MEIAALFYGRKDPRYGRASLETPEIVPRSGQTKKERPPLAISQRRAWILVILLALVVCILLLVLSSITKPVIHTHQYMQERTSPRMG